MKHAIFALVIFIVGLLTGLSVSQWYGLNNVSGRFFIEPLDMEQYQYYEEVPHSTGVMI